MPSSNQQQLDVVWNVSFLPQYHFLQLEYCHHHWTMDTLYSSLSKVPRTFLDDSNSSLLIPSEFIESIYIWLPYLNVSFWILIFWVLSCQSFYLYALPEFKNSCLPLFMAFLLPGSSIPQLSTMLSTWWVPSKWLADWKHKDFTQFHHKPF